MTIPTITISKEDQKSLQNYEETTDPYKKVIDFFEIASKKWRELPYFEIVKDFAKKGNEYGAILIKGLPQDSELPLTPIFDSGQQFTRTLVSEFGMCCVASSLGYPISYKEERWGNTFHNIFPTKKDEGRMPSQTFLTGLEFHTELSCHPKTPDFVILACLRADPYNEAVTSVVGIDNLLNNLSESTVNTLFTKQFALRLSRLHNPYKNNKNKLKENDQPIVSILYGNPINPSIRHEPALITACTDKSKKALDELIEILPSIATSHTLKSGEIIVIDNRRSVHARSNFTAFFDGSDRWLLRMMVRYSVNNERCKGFPIETNIYDDWINKC